MRRVNTKTNNRRSLEHKMALQDSLGSNYSLFHSAVKRKMQQLHKPFMEQQICAPNPQQRCYQSINVVLSLIMT